MVAPAVALGLGSAAISTGGALARLLRGKNRRSAEKLREAGLARAADLGQSVAASQPGVSPALAARQGVLAASQAAPQVLGQAARLESQETAANQQRRDRLVGAIAGGLGGALSSAGASLTSSSPTDQGQQQGPIESPQSAGVATGLGTVGASPGGTQSPSAQVATGGLQRSPQPTQGDGVMGPRTQSGVESMLSGPGQTQGELRGQTQEQAQIAPMGPARPGNPLDNTLADLRGQDVGDLGSFLEQLRGQGKRLNLPQGSLQGGGLPGRRPSDMSEEDLDALLDALAGAR